MITTNPKFRKHLKALAVATTVAAAGAAAQANATSVGIHFTYIYDGTVNVPVDTTGIDVYAGVASQYWNNMAPIDENAVSPLSQTNQNLTTAGATGISLDYSAGNAWQTYYGDLTTLTPYRSYLDDSGSGYSVTIKGLSSLNGGYNLTFLQGLGGDGGSFAGILVYSGVGTTGTLLAQVAPAVLQTFTDGTLGHYGDTISTATLTDDTITIVAAARTGDQRGTLAGIAIATIAVPESQPGICVAAGALFMVSRRLKLKPRERKKQV